jgi:hypothetical protein
MKKKAIVLFGVVVVGALMYVTYYGFSFTFPPCIYTEKDIPLPVELQGTILVVDSREGVYVFEGSNVEGLACSETLGLIEKSIVNGQDARAVYTQQYGAKELESIQGRKLTLKRIIASTKHGINTIGSGSGPLHWLILEDEDGTKYRLGTSYLGLDGQRSFLDVWKDNERKGALIYAGFTDIVSIDSGQGKQ